MQKRAVIPGDSAKVTADRSEVPRNNPAPREDLAFPAGKRCTFFKQAKGASHEQWRTSAYICESNNEDGVGRWLEKNIL
jgi:hypothetical protein